MAKVKEVGLKKVYLKGSALENVLYQDKIGGVNAQGNPTMNVERQTHYAINVETHQGTQTVLLPLGKRFIHPEFNTPIKLINVHVESATEVHNIGGSKRASNELQLFAEDFEITGGNE